MKLTFPYDSGDVAAGDVRWFMVADRNEDIDLLYYRCAAGEWTGDYYKVPDAPTNFSGVSTASPYNTVDTTSEVAFRAPAGARYVAAVGPRQGAVSLSLNRGGRAAAFASPGTHDLGFVRAGDGVILGITPSDGPAAIWDLSITPQPLHLTNASVSRPYARPGQLVTVKHSLTGDAKLDAVVRGKAGVVRQLAAATQVAAGSHSLVWDGLNSNGKPIADGVYSIDLVAGDLFGSTAKTDSSVTIDTHPPKVVFQTPRVISPSRGVVFRVVDLLSGYRKGFVKVDGRSTGFQITRAGKDRYVLRPRLGWTPGSHTVAVTTFDRLRNRGTTQKSFRVS